MMLKFKDLNETVIDKDNLLFFNKKSFKITRITIKHEEIPQEQYLITIVLNAKSEILELLLNYKNKKQRDLDYNKLTGELK